MHDLKSMFNHVRTDVTLDEARASSRVTSVSGATLYQRGPGSKCSKAPLVEVPKARVERRICTSFLGGPGHAHPENF